ncbi:MAG: SHOCT domain-containing protein [Prochloraceae cyanobacterium]|nr:SHOCT domain-containing protein [Prochloraceae cyanobacterium]
MTITESIQVLQNLFSKPKSRKLAVVMALLGTVTPLAFLHKFYLKQPLWGAIYLLLLFSLPQLPHIACAVDAVWYFLQDKEQFDRRFNFPVVEEISSSQLLLETRQQQQAAAIASRVEDITSALRKLDQLREDGLMSEYEFEQKRRQLLDRMS